MRSRSRGTTGALVNLVWVQSVHYTGVLQTYDSRVPVLMSPSAAEKAVLFLLMTATRRFRLNMFVALLSFKP